MSIIQATDFRGEQSLGNVTNNAGSEANLQWFIDEYEKQFLIQLLGKSLYDEFISGLAEQPIDPKWITLRDEFDLKPMLVRYVYYYYIMNDVSNTTANGQVKAKNENSSNVSPIDKMVKAWNDMVRKSRLFDLDTTTYPSYVRPFWNQYWYQRWHCDRFEDNIFEFQNTLNI